MSLSENFVDIKPLLDKCRLHYSVLARDIARADHLLITDRFSSTKLKKKYFISIRNARLVQDRIRVMVRKKIRARTMDLFRSGNYSGISFTDLVTYSYYFEKEALDYVRGVISYHSLMDFNQSIFEGEGKNLDTIPAADDLLLLNRRIIPRHLKPAVAIFFLMLLSACKPGTVRTEDDYMLTIEGRSSIDKRIQDGTTAYFVREGRTDTLFKTMRDEEAAIKIHADEGEAVQGTAGIKENKGHEAAYGRVTIDKDLALPLIMPAKDHDITVEYTITSDGTPIDKALITTPQGTERTDANGEAVIDVTDVDTDDYNNIQHTLEGTITSDAQTSIAFTTKSFTYLLDEEEEAVAISVDPLQSYQHSLAINLISSEEGQGHLVRDSPVTINYSKGDTTISTQGQGLVFNWESGEEDESVTYDIDVAGQGHEDVGPRTISVRASATENRVLNANDWTGDVAYHVTDQQSSDDITGALINTTQNKSGTTNNSGLVTLLGYVIAENTYSEPVATTIDWQATANDYENESGSASINEGSNNVNIAMVPAGTPTYQHSVTFNLVSDEAGEGHLVRDSEIVITDKPNTTTQDQTATYTWTDEDENSSITYYVNVNGTGHDDTTPKTISVGTSTTENITLNANDWTGDVQYHVTDQQSSDDIAGALVNTSQSKSGTTNNSGLVTLLGYVIAENNYSEPVSTSIDWQATADDYQDKSGSASINEGSNNVNIAMTPATTPTYTREVTLQLVSSEAGEGHLVRDSPVTINHPGGSDQGTTSGQNITFSITTEEETITVNYAIDVAGTGHDDRSGSFSVGGSDENESVTLSANDFTGDITYTIKDQAGQNVGGALVNTSQSKSGTTNSSGLVTLLGYVIDENTYSEPVSTSIDHEVSKEGYTTKNGSASINEGSNSVTETIEEIINSYQHRLTINLVSSEAGEGHLVRDSPVVINYSGGETTRTTQGQSLVFSWESSEVEEDITYDIDVNGNGHQDPAAKQTTVGETRTVNETLVANDWTGDVEYHVVDQNTDNVSGALVSTSQSKSGTTNSSGLVTLLGYVIAENLYSEPVATSNSYTVTGDDIQTENGSHDILDGQNSHEVQVQREAGQQYALSGFAMNISGEDLISNQEAFVIKTQYGTYPVNTDSNGEFNVTVTAEQDELVRIYSHASGYQDIMLAVSEHNEPIPRNRRLGSSWGGTDTTKIEAQRLDDDYLRVALVDDWIAADADFQESTCKYEPSQRTSHGTTATMQRYIWSIDPGSGEPAPQEFIDAYTSEFEKMPGMTSLPLTGPLFPINSSITVSETQPSSPTGLWMIYKLDGAGYWNSPYYFDYNGTTLMEGAYAYTGGINLKGILAEQTEWLLPDGLASTNTIYFNGDDTEFFSVNTLGKAVMYTRTDWDP